MGGVPFPRKHGTIPTGRPTPAATLNLQPGELVRVKSYKDILTTLDDSSKNRGLCFDAELVPFCGGVYRVKTRVDKFINEKTGMMSTLKTPAVVLEGVLCQSRYSSRRMFCPRAYILGGGKSGSKESLRTRVETLEQGQGLDHGAVH